MIFNEVLRIAHTGALALYLGGAVIVTISLRRAQRAIPPAQAAIIGSRVGTDFTLISWLALALWGGSGYWLLVRGEWSDALSPHTLFIKRDLLTSGSGWMMVLMVAAWFGMLINAVLITFVFRPRLVRKLPPSAPPERVERLRSDMVLAVRAVDALALMNLLLSVAAAVAGHRFFELTYIY